MEELRIRAWHKKNKQMYLVESIYWSKIEKGKIGSIVLSLDPLPGVRVSFEDVVLMLYTGFQDGSGEDFYDGDIFEEDAEWFVIKWWQNEGQWMAVPIIHNPLERDNMALAEFSGSATCWKQGNIFENPEWMERSK